MNDPVQQVTQEVGVVLARRLVDNPWTDHVWVPHAVLSSAPDVAIGAILSDGGGVSLHYAGAATVELFASDTASYRANLQSGDPRMWISCRSSEDGGLPHFLRVTCDPSEGEAMFEGGSDIVGTVALPPAFEQWIAGFVDAFHVERVFLKRQRDRSEKRRAPDREGR